MCFAPQRRALVRHLNFQKWSENGVFLHFWFGNVLRATTACTFSTSQLPKVVWDSGFFNTFDLEMCFAPQRRAIFHLSSGQMAPHPPLERGYFSTLQSPKSLEKHSESRLSYLFTHLHLLSSDFLPLWSSPSLIFSSLTLPISAFPSLHIVGSLTSKLPSMIHWVNASTAPRQAIPELILATVGNRWCPAFFQWATPSVHHPFTLRSPRFQWSLMVPHGCRWPASCWILSSRRSPIYLRSSTK